MLQDGEKGVIVQRDKKNYAVAPHIRRRNHGLIQGKLSAYNTASEPQRNSNRRK